MRDRQVWALMQDGQPGSYLSLTEESPLSGLHHLSIRRLDELLLTSGKSHRTKSPIGRTLQSFIILDLWQYPKTLSYAEQVSDKPRVSGVCTRVTFV